MDERQRTTGDGPPYEPREYTGNTDLDADIDRAFNVLGSIVSRSNLDDDDRRRLPTMVLGCIHNLTLEVQQLRAAQQEE